MTLKHLQDFQAQIQAQIEKHKVSTPNPGQEMLFHLGAIELHCGLNLVNQLIVLEHTLLAAPPGATGPEI